MTNETAAANDTKTDEPEGASNTPALLAPFKFNDETMACTWLGLALDLETGEQLHDYKMTRTELEQAKVVPSTARWSSAISPVSKWQAKPDLPTPPKDFVFDPRVMSLLSDGSVMEWKKGKVGKLICKYESREVARKEMKTVYETTTKPAASPASGPVLSDPPSSRSKHVAAIEHPVPAHVDSVLLNILSWPRGHTTPQELAFCRWLRGHLAAAGHEVKVGAEGCVIVAIDPPPPAVLPKDYVVKTSKVLFSCHIDTIENGTGKVELDETTGHIAHVERKQLTYDPNFGLIALEKDSIGGSLGADDGAGLWLMLKMLERRVPGTYVFHRGEERGGIGSAAMRDKFGVWLSEFNYAVAFDRANTFEVIFKQGGQRCASDEFTKALCDKLTEKGMKYEPSDRGSFTDTKNYRTLIPECVNLGVGYYDQHGKDETLDFSHLSALLEAVCLIDWDALPVKRNPKEVESYSYGGYGSAGYGGRGRQYGYGGGASGQMGLDEEDDENWPGAPAVKKTKKAKKRDKLVAAVKSGLNNPPKVNLKVSDELSTNSLEDILVWAEESPVSASEAIGHLLVEVAQLKATNKVLMAMLGWEDDVVGT